MIEKFENYLAPLPLTQVVKGRIEEILVLNFKINQFEIKDIFICEFKNEEGSRNYTSIWLFTDSYCIECKNFLVSNDFDITPYVKMFTYCSLSFSNFDLVTATDKSIVSIDLRFLNSLSGVFTATEQNCLSAINIYQNYFLPNLIK